MTTLEKIQALISNSEIADGDEVDEASAKFSQWLNPMVSFDNWGKDEFGEAQYVYDMLYRTGSVWGYIFSQKKRIAGGDITVESAVSRTASMFGNKVAEVARDFLRMILAGEKWMDAFETLSAKEDSTVDMISSEDSKPVSYTIAVSDVQIASTVNVPFRPQSRIQPKTLMVYASSTSHDGVQEVTSKCFEQILKIDTGLYGDTAIFDFEPFRTIVPTVRNQSEARRFDVEKARRVHSIRAQLSHTPKLMDLSQAQGRKDYELAKTLIDELLSLI